MIEIGDIEETYESEEIKNNMDVILEEEEEEGEGIEIIVNK